MRGIRYVVMLWAELLFFVSPVVAHPLQVDFFGDSTTAGAQTVAGKMQLSKFSEPVLVHAGLRAHFGEDVIVNNFGIGGTQAVELLRGEMGYEQPWLERMMYSKADVVVINYSWNDKDYFFSPREGRDAVSPERFTDILKELIFVAKWAGKTVVLQDPNPGDFDHSKGGPLQQYIDAIHDVAKEADVPLVSNFEYIMTIPDWRTYLSEDKVHPADALYAIKAKRSLDVIIPLSHKIIDRKTRHAAYLKMRNDVLVDYALKVSSLVSKPLYYPAIIKMPFVLKYLASRAM